MVGTDDVSKLTRELRQLTAEAMKLSRELDQTVDELKEFVVDVERRQWQDPDYTGVERRRNGGTGR